jgi:hypothetical protein
MIKYILLVSVIANGILIMTVTGILPFLLFVSVVFSLVLVWYAAQITRQMKRYRNDLEAASSGVEQLRQHISSIYELEMFYGDSTLEGLINHSKAVVDDLEYFTQKYTAEE